jgi:hypothetical protein
MSVTTLGEALSGAPRWQRDLVAKRVGVAKPTVDEWARTGAPNLAGWVRRTIADIVRPRPQSPPLSPPASSTQPDHAAATLETTPLALALSQTHRLQRVEIAESLGLNVRELRRRAREGWQPEPMARRQIGLVLRRDPADLFPALEAMTTTTTERR